MARSSQWSVGGVAGALAALALIGLAGAARADDRVWVQLTDHGAEVRVATAATACPPALVDGQALPMRTRAPPSAEFPVTLCQLPLPAGVRRASVEGRDLPLPVARPQRILIFGDTGCRLKGAAVQDCNDPRAWPFAVVARRAAAHHPDLVIHVGDYYYRESPCPAGQAGCAGSPWGDNWTTWDAEFFQPAAPLLAAAPWILVRGNHESCTRGGPGWFRLLDAGAAMLACPSMSTPWSTDIGGLKLYVLDSADTEDRATPPAAVADFSAQLDAFKRELAGQPGWILTHRPIWGEAPVASVGPVGPFELAINATEQAAVRGRDLSAVRMVVSGHIHHFASFDFGPARPAQLIAGTGGDVGEEGDVPRARNERVDLDGLAADSFTFERYGFLILDRAGEDWTGAFYDLDDRVIARCRLHDRALRCVGVTRVKTAAGPA